MMLSYGRGRPDEARLLDGAVDEALRWTPTVDLGGTATTEEFGDAVVSLLTASKD
jgi:isocitrate/isopropylmalate dehydrogenase